MKIKPGDFYEDCAYHPVLCTEINEDEDRISGVSLIDGSYPRDCSLVHCRIKKLTFEEAVDRVTEELKKEGFGILTEIDVQQKMQEKLNEDFIKYKILGACNPKYAFQALQLEDKIGTMLPCNVIVQEAGS